MNNKGFTLIECMIVIAIVGILAAILIPTIILNNTHKEIQNKNVEYSKFNYSKHCIEGYVFIGTGFRCTLHQLRGAGGEGIPCEDYEQ